jgi:hypothetical protein
MSEQSRRISFDEFARHPQAALDAVQSGKQAILIERQGELFRVEKEQLHGQPDIWAGYSADRVLAGFRKSAGGFRGLDRDTFLADMKEQREQDSRGRPA